MSQSHGEELNGWKEIAGYLRVSIRTAQKLEKDQGLPLRRGVTQKGPVFAMVAEIEDWRSRRTQRPIAEAPLVPPPEIRSLRSKLDVAVKTIRQAGYILQAPVEPPDEEKKRAVLPRCLPSPGQSKNILKTNWLVAGLTAVILLSAVGLIILRQLWVRRDPSRVTIAGRMLTMLDQENRPMWRFELPGTPAPLPVAGDYSSARPVIADFGNEGKRELLYAFTNTTTVGPADTLYCFSSSGSVRWTHHLGREIRTIGTGRLYPANYTLTWIGVLARATPAGGRIVIGGHRGGSSLFAVEILTPQGQVVGEYYHPGWLWAMATTDLDGDGFDEIILGGVNDAYGNLSGFDHPVALVILDSRHVSGQGPAPPTDDRHFDGLDSGRERAALLLPSFGQGQSDDPSNFCAAQQILVMRNHFEVLVMKMKQGEMSASYQFDRHLNLEMVSPSGRLAEFLVLAAKRPLTQVDRVDWYSKQLGDIRVLKNDFASGK